MKRSMWSAVVVSLLMCGMAAGQGRPRPGVPHEPPLLTVTGTAEVSVAPDRAILRLGATAEAEQAAEAQSRVNQIVQRTLEALRGMRIDKQEISTSGLSLNPVYSQPGPRGTREEPFVPKISGYQASNTVEVRITDLKKVGPAIDAAVGAGANRVESLTFDLKDDTDARSKALAEAVERARAKAKVLAEAADVPLGRLFSIDEESGFSPPVPYRGGAMRALAMEASTPIEPGQVRVTATVMLRYLIAPER